MEWHNLPPTDKQMALIKKIGWETEGFCRKHPLTRKEASNLILRRSGGNV